MTTELSEFAARLRGLIPRPDFPVEAFGDLALELFALQYQSNPAYRACCAARKVTPLTASDWRLIPAVPAAAFKEFDLTCLPPESRSHVFHSSGTTVQRPSRHFHSEESLAVYEASLWASFKEYLRWPIAHCHLTALTPPPAQAPHSSLVHMVETIRRQLGAPETVFVGRAASDGAWLLDFDAAQSRLTDLELQSSGVKALLLGTAFSFVHLFDFLAERNLRLQLPPGSQVMETGGYKGRSRSLPREELHALISERLGVPASHIVCEYGMSELSSQAYAAERGPLIRIENSGVGQRAGSQTGAPAITRHFHFPPWARAQIVSPESGREVGEGESGLLRILDLANVYSVMAIQTEDLAVRRGEGFELFGRARLAEPRGCSLMAV